MRHVVCVPRQYCWHLLESSSETRGFIPSSCVLLPWPVWFQCWEQDVETGIFSESLQGRCSRRRADVTLRLVAGGHGGAGLGVDLVSELRSLNSSSGSCCAYRTTASSSTVCCSPGQHNANPEANPTQSTVHWVFLQRRPRFCRVPNAHGRQIYAAHLLPLCNHF